MKYTCGTSESAAHRLEEIANFFNPLAIKFIHHYSETSIDSALDLGCGPGFTTDMLSKATACSQVYGIDNSTGFLKRSILSLKKKEKKYPGSFYE